MRRKKMENEDIWKWSESSEEHRFGRLPFDHYVLVCYPGSTTLAP